MLLKQALHDNKEARRVAAENSARLVSMTFRRQGAEFVEYWQDGTAFMDIYKRQKEIFQLREELMRQRKVLAKRKPANRPAIARSSGAAGGVVDADGFVQPDSVNSASAPAPLAATAGDDSDVYTYDQWFERDEVLQLRLAALTKEDKELSAELERLGTRYEPRAWAAQPPL